MGFELLSSILVLIGAGFMVFSIRLGRSLQRDVPKELNKRWRVLIVLKFFFLAGYLFFVTVLFSNYNFPLELITGFMFLGGAFFVFIVINLSKDTIRSIKDKEQEITEINSALEVKVMRRTAELSNMNEQLENEIIVRNKAEEELLEFSDKLEKSNLELESFARVASHDLQEPLRKVMAFGDRLVAKYADKLDDKGCDYLNRMQSAAKRMQKLIDGLLTYSRVTTKANPFEAVDLNELATDVIGDLETRVAQTGGQIEVDDLSTVAADPLQIRQLMQNLIGNALKFTRENEPPVVKVHGEVLQNSEDGDREFYQITVEDNGIGFEEEYSESIFGVFQRLHGRQEYEGTGIGLSICKRIVERHKGSIIAKSAPGKGASFIITLPIEQIEGGSDGS